MLSKFDDGDLNQDSKQLNTSQLDMWQTYQVVDYHIGYYLFEDIELLNHCKF
ncbi:28058_t:CDS:2 [Gigaspora margarita]|uniref:28058_t:CDS:1 n=1 Tax=Gigaspora margarita TaxID=4874 RepID=A0ABN7UED6_GIGMA|nr:28058_t:CDS:2 [Gigaspora margarita]